MATSLWTMYTATGHRARYYPVRHLEYKDVHVEPLGPGPWRHFTRDGRQTLMRVIGRLFCDTLDTDTGEQQYAVFTLVQAETRDSYGLYSTYSSRILIGTHIDEEADEQGLASMLQGVGLWCSNCWSDDCYGNGTGGVAFPTHMRGRYYGKLHHHEGCATCGAKFAAFGDSILPVTDAHAYVFGTIHDPPLQTTVEAFFLPRGIYTTSSSRSEETALTPEQKEAIAAAAMAPSRVGALVQTHGLDAAIAAF
jgi:hypothetical protein